MHQKKQCYRSRHIPLVLVWSISQYPLFVFLHIISICSILQIDVVVLRTLRALASHTGCTEGAFPTGTL